MKKLPILILILALALLALAGCGNTNSPAPAEENKVAEEILSGLDDAAEEPAEESVPAEEAGTQQLPAGLEPAFRFSTTLLDGTAVDESILAGHALTMINFFEPWCPPCVAELPELERLYETYAPEGFQILGVFSTEEGVETVLSEAGVSYPVLRYVPVFDVFQTGYVPTTVFVNERGELLGQTQIGANSYEGWEAIVKELLG
ncbi:MAG: TlpA family protein disulfide reductase [Oscillospiraceae bacterium]|nr:TlpA family protein disulfide reductase [Oscillospiraceae bacterium]